MVKQIIAGGLGFVGKVVKELLPEAEIYDKGYDVPEDKYQFCHVCVPTPSKLDGSCDFSAVQDVISKINTEVFIIRSTIPPGTTVKLGALTGSGLVFQPEYCASSSPYPAPLSDLRYHPFIVLGGDWEPRKKVRRLYESIYPPTTRFVEMSSLEAEICKYMENSFIATYVTFCNEFYDICQKYDADYDKVREGFLADPRMTKYWTYVYQNMRGWGGHCLPKDVSSIICETGSLFMKAIAENNRRHQNEQ